MLIQPRQGSYWFLGVILLVVELACDAPFQKEHCGTCSACLSACPTGALLARDETGAPRMAARRCISYLTIETKAPVPDELGPALGDHLFGCDICQDVCPWNRKPIPPNRPEFQPRASSYRPLLTEIEALAHADDATFEASYEGTPLLRAGRERLASRAASIRAARSPSPEETR